MFAVRGLILDAWYFDVQCLGLIGKSDRRLRRCQACPLAWTVVHGCEIGVLHGFWFLSRASWAFEKLIPIESCSQQGLQYYEPLIHEDPIRCAECKEFQTIHPSFLLGGLFCVRVCVATDSIHWTADYDRDWLYASVRSHTGPLIDMRCRWEPSAMYLD